LKSSFRSLKWGFLRNALFKRGLERNGKNKNGLEFDVEKDGGIIFRFWGLIKN
jgi:hypothetical protein